MIKKQATSGSPQTISLGLALAAIDKFYSPETIAHVNDTAIKITKFKGEFLWHFHENEDELFLVLEGKLLMRLRSGDVWVNKGEFIVVPRGVEHCPVAPDDVHVLLVEPRSIKKTGNLAEDSTAAARG